MKRNLPNTSFGVLLACLLVFCSCGAKKTKMDTTTFDKAFQTAPAEIQTLAAKASKAFKDGKFEVGANALVDITRKSGLTDPQKDGIRDVIIIVQTIMSQDSDKSDIKVHQALEIASATLEGRPPMRVGVNPSSLDQPNR